MAHVLKNGRAGWISPNLYKTDSKNENRTNISSMSGGAALSIAVGYVLTATDLSNKTARKAAPDVLAAMKAGKKDDIFILAFPIVDDNGVETGKDVDTHSMTRGDLIARCAGIVKISELLEPAEEAAEKIAEGLPSPVVVAPMPYGGGKRGKRAGNVLTV